MAGAYHAARVFRGAKGRPRDALSDPEKGPGASLAGWTVSAPWGSPFGAASVGLTWMGTRGYHHGRRMGSVPL